MNRFTIVVPFWNGNVDRLLATVPAGTDVLIVDDHSDVPPDLPVRTIKPKKKGYFTGAVNAGLRETKGDVLILNQDTWFEGEGWLDFLSRSVNQYDLIGEGIAGNHPAWPRGYIHGTFMYVKRQVIDAIGLMDAVNYPLWGSTCEYQLRACRKGFKALPVAQGKVPSFRHGRNGGYGSAIAELLKREPGRKGLFIRTPPLVSVIIPSYNHGRYLDDAINSLIGGQTSLGQMPGQTLQSFEIIIVDDGSTDETPEVGKRLADPWKGIHYIRQHNGGTSVANNTGIRASNGKYITILCADDMMEPDRLRLMLEAQQIHLHSVVYDDLISFEAGNRGRIWKMPEYDFDVLLHKNHMHAGIMFPKAAWSEVGGYPEEMVYGREDWAFNVRLGIHGWCGFHLGNGGYLYRREGQNRTLTNTTPKWHARFLEQLRLLYPEVYQGIRPMACCGGKKRGRGARRPRRAVAMATKQKGTLPGADGMVALRYIGGNAGWDVWRGPATHTPYKFGGSRLVGLVDVKDVDGMLQLMDGDRKAFARYTPPKKVKTEPEPLPEPIAEPDVQDREDIDLGEPERVVMDSSDFTVKELRDKVEAGEFSDEQIMALIESENSRPRPRKTALEALRGVKNAI